MLCARVDTPYNWGVAPAYDGEKPSAKRLGVCKAIVSPAMHERPPWALLMVGNPANDRITYRWDAVDQKDSNFQKACGNLSLLA